MKKRVCLSIVALFCIINLYAREVILENRTPFQVSIVSKQVSGPVLNKVDERILETRFIEPWGREERTIFLLDKPERGASYRFERTVDIASNPPMRFTLQDYWEYSGILRKKGFYQLADTEEISLQLPNKPSVEVIYSRRKTHYSRSLKEGIYTLGTIRLHGQKRLIILRTKRSFLYTYPESGPLVKDRLIIEMKEVAEE